MTVYILQTITFQLVFLALYELLLKKETFFQWNRVYLLVTPVISLILPFIKIGALKTTLPQNLVVSLPEINLGPTTEAIQNNLAATSTMLSIFEIVLLYGMAISTLLFLFKLYKIKQLKRKGRIESFKNATLVNLPNSTDAFSFAGTIYLGENLNSHSKEYILSHELVHIKQKHYLDLFYFELLRIVFWFNPLVYIYQKRIASLHEYIADAEVVAISNKAAYYQNLLSEVFQTHTISFVNTFFNHSLIKNRIVMLHKKKSKATQMVKFSLLLPCIAAMMFVSSCEFNENYSTDVDSEEHIVTLDTINKNKNSVYDVPFAVIDQVPIYPGCENLITNEERKQCMTEKINQLVGENFDTSIGKNNGLTGMQRIAVQFKIDKDGNVTDVRSRAPIEPLEEEGIRVINLLPKMQPGMQDGNVVGVLYSLPIRFEINE